MPTPRYAMALTTVIALAAAAQAAELRGVVGRVDPDKKELIVDGRGLLRARGTEMVFELTDQTAVLVGDQAGTLADVTAGRRVRVEYEIADGRQVAQAVHLLGGPAPVAAAVPAVPPAGDALTGVLRHVGYSDREIVLVGPGPKGADAETTVAVPEAARIVKNGKEAKLDDLKEGDAATLQVEKKDGRTTALSVQVGAGAPVTQAEKPPSNVIPKLRLMLKVADMVLQGMEKKDGDR